MDLDEGGQKPRRGAAAKLLEYSCWLSAWDSYSVACAVVGQLSYRDALQHKLLVQQLATEAAAQKRRPLLAVLYDDHIRCDRWQDYGWVFAVLSSQEDVGRTQSRNARLI